MERLRIKPVELDLITDVGTLHALLGSTKTPSSIAHDALMNGLQANKRKLSEIVSRVSNKEKK